MQIPSLVYADSSGKIYDHPELKMSMSSAGFDFMPYEAELIPMPDGSKLYFMPDTKAVGFDMAKGIFRSPEIANAVSALLPPGYLRLSLPSYLKTEEKLLPPYAYTAVGWLNERFVVPAIKVDEPSKQKTQRDFFDPALGAAEIVETIRKQVAEKKISMAVFGSPSNDPLDDVETAVTTVKLVRKEFADLTIAVNTDGCDADAVAKVLDAGADSISFNIVSALESTYNAFNEPSGRKFSDFTAGLEAAIGCNAYVALNLLILPGLNDRKTECQALVALLSAHKIDLIKTLNHAADPASVYNLLKLPQDEVMGVKNMLIAVKKAHKQIRYGSFDRPRADFQTDSGLPDLKPRKFKK